MKRLPKKIYKPERFDGGDPCAGGCGRTSVPRSVYCQECKDVSVDTPPPETDYDLDVLTEVLEEQMRGETSIQKRLAEQGTRPCGLCGRPSLSWRLYCSPTCRGKAARLGPVMFELDGVMDSAAGHANRRGIKYMTVFKRVSRGMDILEALTKPVDERPLFERRVS